MNAGLGVDAPLGVAREGGAAVGAVSDVALVHSEIGVGLLRHCKLASLYMRP